MNRQRHSLAMRKQAIDHLIAHGRSTGISETILEAAEDGADFLAWVVKREKLLRELERLERDRPGLCEALTAWPGADVRVIE